MEVFFFKFAYSLTVMYTHGSDIDLAYLSCTCKLFILIKFNTTVYTSSDIKTTTCHIQVIFASGRLNFKLITYNV